MDRVQPLSARRTLGIRIAPDGNQQQQKQHMFDTAVAWGDSIRTGHLSRHDAWLALQSTILRFLDFPLPVTSLTKWDCNAIMSPILQTALPASGVARNFPRAVVHGPLRYQGLQVPNLYTNQGIAHIQQLLTFGFDQFLFQGRCKMDPKVSRSEHIENWCTHCRPNRWPRTVCLSNAMKNSSCQVAGKERI